MDEHLYDARLEEALAAWYPGQIVYLRTLRPKTLIKDDAVATLLLQLKQPTFVTINWSDFWRQISPNRRYCTLCFALSLNHVDELPSLLRGVLRLEPFRTKHSRTGKVARVLKSTVQYYGVHDSHINSMKIF